MNKEEILNTFLLANIPEIITQEEFDDVKKAIKDLQQENQKLKKQLKYNTPDENIAYFKGKNESKMKINRLRSDIKELKEENQTLKKQLEELEEENFNLIENIYIEKISFSSEGRNIKELIEMPTYEDLLNKQKEFIEYMNKTIEELECEDFDDEEMKCYLIQRIDTFKEILSKYKEITGDDK